MLNTLRHLRFRQKFLLLAGLLIALAGLPTALSMKASWQAMAAAQAEAAGVAPAEAVLRWIDQTQQHRGLSAAVLQGRADFAARRSALAEAMATQARGVAQSTALYAGHPERDAAWRGLTDTQAGLIADVARAGLSGEQSFARHTALVAGQLRLLESVVDASTLALDPAAGTYYTITAALGHLPRAAELTGQLRGLGLGVLARGRIEPAEQHRLAARLEMMRAELEQAERALAKAESADAALVQPLAGPRAEARRLTEAAVQRVTALVEGRLEAQAQPEAYFKTVTAAIDAQYALMTRATAALQAALGARVSEARRDLALTVAGAVLMLVLMAGLIGVISRQIGGDVRRTLRVAEAMAAGDLSQRIGLDTRDEIGEIARALDAAVGRVGHVIAEVRAGVDAVQTASTQIAAGNQDLSTRTEQQASNLQETAASMEQMHGSVKTTADHTRAANELAVSAARVAAEGGQAVTAVHATMDEIRRDSSRISDIIGLIDGIAFQTNILALNAAVEAARAGEQGRGFAVVAAEVRALAQKSALAAKDIKTLVGASVARVADGSQQVLQASQTMDAMVQQVQRVADLLTEVNASNSEQARGIAQVNAAVTQLDQSTQQNAALVEESAAAAESLRQQADRLAEATARFVVQAVAGASRTQPA